MLKQGPLKWSAKLTASSFPLFYKAVLYKSTWKVSEVFGLRSEAGAVGFIWCCFRRCFPAELWAGLSPVPGDEHSHVSNNRELHNKTAIVSLSTTKEWHQLADDMNFHFGQEWNSFLMFTNTKESRQQRWLKAGTMINKLNRAMQSLLQPQGLRASQTHCLPVTPAWLSPITNTALRCLGRGNHHTDHIAPSTSTWSHLLTWQSSHSPKATSKNRPFIHC